MSFLPETVPQFRFPNPKERIARVYGDKVTMVVVRLDQNRKKGVPWDTPFFDAEIQAKETWESTWKQHFEPGKEMTI